MRHQFSKRESRKDETHKLSTSNSHGLLPTRHVVVWCFDGFVCFLVRVCLWLKTCTDRFMMGVSRVVWSKYVMANEGDYLGNTWEDILTRNWTDEKTRKDKKKNQREDILWSVVWRWMVEKWVKWNDVLRWCESDVKSGVFHLRNDMLNAFCSASRSVMFALVA